ncbi:MAG: tetratricopeptide repeat protein [Deltaproteobacteria bacterium]|nr:tetratricopeptide repeat protein [Deltaproteobacteria bacterium]
MTAHRSKAGPTLVPASVLIGIGVVFGGLLYGLFPDRSVKVLEQAPTDALSIIHLRLALEAAPHDQRVRLLLATQLAELGRFDEAEQVLAPALFGTEEERALALALSIERARWLASSGAEREQRREHLALRLWLGHPTTVGMAELALDLGEPRLAARIFEALGDQERRVREVHLGRAAQAWAAAGDPEAAARILVALAEGEKDPVRARRHWWAAAQQAEAAGDRGAARRWITRALAFAPSAPELWERALALALADGDATGAAAIARDYWAHTDRTRSSLGRRLARVLVGAGDNRGALEILRSVEVVPGSEDEVLWAQLEEWTGHPDQALRVWQARWRRSGRPSDRRELERLARLTYADQVLLEVLEVELSQGDFQPRLLLEVVQRAEAQGQPERALSLLATVKKRHPEVRLVDQERARVLGNLGRIKEALALGAEDCRRYGCPAAVELQRARQTWQIGDAEGALAQLRSRHPEAQEQEHWELLAGVAFSLEAQVDLQLALAALARLGALDADGYVRWVEVLAALQQPERAKEVALEGYDRHHSGELLTVAMDVLLRAGRLAEADQLLAAADRDPEPVQDRAYWWMLRAQLDRRQGRALAYEVDLLALAKIDPSNDDAWAGVLWSQLERDDRRQLAASYRSWRGQGQTRPGLWRPLAAAADRLGHPEEAARWYQHLYQAGATDPLLWLEYARALDATGQKVAAWRLRQAALQSLDNQRRPEEAYLRLATADQLGAEGAAARAAEELSTRAPAHDGEAAVLAEHYLQQGSEVRAKVVLALAPSLSGARLALALREQDLVLVSRLLEEQGPQLSAAQRAEALLALGHEEEALHLALAEWQNGDESEQAALLALAEDVVRRRPNRLRAEGGWSRLGTLELREAGAEVQVARHDLGARLAARFSELIGVQQELQLTAGGTRHWGRGATQLAFGLLLDPRQLIPQLEFAQSLQLGRRWSLGLEGRWAERIDDTELLRRDGLRDRVALNAGLALWPRLELAVNVAGVRYRERVGEDLGRGVIGELVIRQRLLVAGPHFQARFAASGGLLSLEPKAEGTLAPQFGGAGLGLSASSEDDDQEPPLGHGLGYRADLYAGWLWPGNGPVFQVEAAGWRSLLGGDELGLLARAGNALAFDQSVRASVELYYAYRFWP